MTDFSFVIPNDELSRLSFLPRDSICIFGYEGFFEKDLPKSESSYKMLEYRFPLPERLDRESFFLKSSFYAFFVPSHSELRLDMESIGPKWQPLILPIVWADHHPFILALLHSLLTRQPTTRGFRRKMDSFIFAWPDREQLQPRGSPTLPTAFALRSDLGLDPERRSRVPCHVFC